MHGLLRASSLACVLFLTVSAPATASAQDAAGRWKTSVKCGVFVPAHGVMREQTTGEWWYLGVDIDPGFRHKPANGTVSFGVDFDYRDAEGRGVFTIPILVKVVWPITSQTSDVYLYGGLGPGAYFMNSRYSGAVTKPGMQFIAGLDLGKRVFVELAYDWVSGFHDNAGNALRADGVKVALGVRF